MYFLIQVFLRTSSVLINFDAALMRPVSILRLLLRSVVATPSESKIRFGAIHSLNSLVQSIRFQPVFFVRSFCLFSTLMQLS